eukprot:212226-Rhodomonas_salina.1
MYKRKREAEWEAVPIKDQLAGLKEVVDSGKVKHIGLSNETPFGVMEFCRLAELHGLPKVVSLQNVYSLLVRSPPRRLRCPCSCARAWHRRRCWSGLVRSALAPGLRVLVDAAVGLSHHRVSEP